MRLSTYWINVDLNYSDEHDHFCLFYTKDQSHGLQSLDEGSFFNFLLSTNFGGKDVAKYMSSESLKLIMGHIRIVRENVYLKNGWDSREVW